MGRSGISPYFFKPSALTLSARRLSTVQFLWRQADFPITSWRAFQCRGWRQGFPRAVMMGSCCLKSITDCLRWGTMLFLGRPANTVGRWAYNPFVTFSEPDLVYQLLVCTEITSFTHAASHGMNYGLKRSGEQHWRLKPETGGSHAIRYNLLLGKRLLQGSPDCY